MKSRPWSTYSATRIVLGLLMLFSMLALGHSFYNASRMHLPPLPPNPAYRDSSLPIDTRVADILTHMSLKEKIGQMALVEKNSLEDLDHISTYGLGGMLSGFGGKPDENTGAEWKRMIETFVTESRTSRLGIPLLYGVDAIHGHSNVPGATVFPHFIGLGASGNPTLVERVARATARELLATGVRWSYSPTYDMPEDIRWGRVYEAFSDDPLRVSTLGSAYIRGLQTPSATGAAPLAVLATPKHYIGAGGMIWGNSSNENFSIDQGITPKDEEKLRTHYLPPFEKALESGALSVMVGLNSWGETKLAADAYLIQTVLKDELGFKGFVVSDWYGVYEIPGGNYAAAVTAINAGVDMVMLPFDYKEFTRNVYRAVENGDIAESRIDDAVKRILTAKFALGLFDESEEGNLSELGTDDHRALARTAVAESLVLLKNNEGILPISNTVSTIRVAGSAADNIGRQAGAWTVEWQGVDGNWLPGATSILEGIREIAPPGTGIEFDREARFTPGSPKALLGIAIVGEAPYAEGWGDTPNPRLSAEDLETIERLREASEKVIVVLITGRPLFITDELPAWDAVVVAWLPGSEGAGVSDVLFGKKAFTGTLPFPWPRTPAQLPIVRGKTADGSAPLFPRYFGLRY
jgi:beta-glucosidase